MKLLKLFISLLLLSLLSTTFAADYEITAPVIVHSGVDFTVTIEPVKRIPDLEAREIIISANDKVQSTIAVYGKELVHNDMSITKPGNTKLVATSAGVEIADRDIRVIPGWYSILPPVVAIGLALWLRSVIPAIFLGVWIGAIAREGFTFKGILVALVDAFQVDVLNAMANRDHVSIILFTCMIGGMVGVISRNGGMQGIVDIVVKWADTARRGQLSVWFLGLCIFFDDYTNTLVVGNAVRPVTDKLKISREKLAYIVDSTAAPVACIALITTWIGYEVGLISKSIENLQGFDGAAYAIFLNSIPYSFYPIFAIIFVFLVANSGRDFGPMLVAEKRSLGTGQVTPPSNQKSISGNEEGSMEVDVPAGMPKRAVNALIPIVVLVFSCVLGLYITGKGETIQAILSTADAYQALMLGSLMGALTAIFLTLAQRILSLHEVIAAWTTGVNVMVAPLIILILAWAMSDITAVLGTADYLVRLGGDALSPQTVPAWTFIIAAATAFATGSSWGAMAILMPLFIPFCWATLVNAGAAHPENFHILYSTISCVLAGAVWGDHCSPISDTTVLSSLATNCDHIEHVRTQMPYAITVGLVALLVGTIPVAYGFPFWLAIPLGIVVLVLVIRFVARPSVP